MITVRFDGCRPTTNAVKGYNMEAALKELYSELYQLALQLYRVKHENHLFCSVFACMNDFVLDLATISVCGKLYFRL